MAKNKRDIELIIFDLGRVLVDFDFQKVVHDLRRYSPKTVRQIRKFFKTTPLWDAFERGKVKPRDFFKTLQQKLRLKGLTYKEFITVWNDIFKEKADTVALLRQLRRRYQLAMLSNVNIMHWKHIRKQHPFMRWFDHPVASYAVGHRKPEKEIYHHTLRLAGVPAERAVFIDDVKAHVVAARKLGIHAFQFRDAKTLRKDLKRILG